MDKETFDKRKQELLSLVEEALSSNSEDPQSLEELKGLLNQYSYENRLSKKGLLAHTIVDSLQLSYTLGEEFIKFDNEL